MDTRVRSKVELARMLAELMTIKSIDGRVAEVLADIGITNLQQLAEQESETLLDYYYQQVEKLGHATVKRWLKKSLKSGLQPTILLWV